MVCVNLTTTTSVFSIHLSVWWRHYLWAILYTPLLYCTFCRYDFLHVCFWPGWIDGIHSAFVAHSAGMTFPMWIFSPLGQCYILCYYCTFCRNDFLHVDFQPFVSMLHTTLLFLHILQARLSSREFSALWVNVIYSAFIAHSAGMTSRDLSALWVWCCNTANASPQYEATPLLVALSSFWLCVISSNHPGYAAETAESLFRMVGTAVRHCAVNEIKSAGPHCTKWYQLTPLLQTSSAIVSIAEQNKQWPVAQSAKQRY